MCLVNKLEYIFQYNTDIIEALLDDFLIFDTYVSEIKPGGRFNSWNIMYGGLYDYLIREYFGIFNSLGDEINHKKLDSITKNMESIEGKKVSINQECQLRKSDRSIKILWSKNLGGKMSLKELPDYISVYIPPSNNDVRWIPKHQQSIFIFKSSQILMKSDSGSETTIRLCLDTPSFYYHRCREPLPLKTVVDFYNMNSSILKIISKMFLELI